MWSYFPVFLAIDVIFLYETVQYNEYLVSNVDTDGLVL